MYNTTVGLSRRDAARVRSCCRDASRPLVRLARRIQARHARRMRRQVKAVLCPSRAHRLLLCLQAQHSCMLSSRAGTARLFPQLLPDTCL